jgi:SAM-dependent methyltransferase
MPEYTLSNSDAERRRLARQAEVLRPVTERLFRSAGITDGARVLDVGCGGGDVTELLVDLVGTSGAVTAFDRDPAQVAATAQRFAAAANVTVVEGSIDDPPAGEFDAVVGRLVLMYQPDLDAAIASLARRCKHRGIMAFLESNNRPDAPQALYWPPSALNDKIAGWIEKAWGSTSVQYLVGIRVPAALRAAGLEPQHPYEPGALIYEGEHRIEMTTGLLRSMLPALERAGVDPEEIDIDTLGDRMRADGGNGQLSVVGPLLGVWARKPA